MTARQITKKLEAAGISLENLTIGANKVDVYVTDVDGDHDYDATDALAERVGSVLGFGGSRAAYGCWHLEHGYKVDEFAGSIYGRDQY